MDYPKPWKRYESEFKIRVTKSLGDFGLDIKPVIERPRKGEADLCLVCFPLARDLKMRPDEVALELEKRIEPCQLFDLDAKGGYLNCTFKRPEYIRDICKYMWSMRGNIGKEEENKETIIIEHTSANPNGPFHVGRARNPMIGDTLVRIMVHAGYDVSSQYWVNDMGKQVMILVWGMFNLDDRDLPEKERDKEDHDLVRYYQMANSMMEEDVSILDEINTMLGNYEAAVSEGDLDRIISMRRAKDIRARDVRKACDSVLAGMKMSLERLNVLDQEMIYESRVVEDGSLEEVIDKLKESPLCRVEDGARYLDLSKEIEGGDDDEFKRRFVFTRSDGSALYTTRDLAYHKWKLDRCDLAINILGEDHRYQANMLSLALRELGVDRRPETVFYSFVSLPEGKMSTRKNRVVFLDDLLDEAVHRAREEVMKRRRGLLEDELANISTAVGIGALRFNMIKVQPEKKIVFRWEDALNFEGSSAPFVQYSHARACSILQRSEDILPTDVGWEELVERAETDLAVRLFDFKDVVFKAANERKVHLITVYLVDVASRFNEFYRDCPVLSEQKNARRVARLSLVEIAREVLSTGLSLIGVESPSSM